ncbi:MAG: hypothetical protein M0R21_12695 [Lentimicrobiaceae bacterium]|nr:hypothetical protein [Lentimicrobiaceae bacterium]
MIELVSYWKATCSPKVYIKPAFLSGEQLLWWKKLYYKGLGEFFYLNSINTSQGEFMEIETSDGNEMEFLHLDLADNYLVPIGGGKDSVVTLEILKEYNYSTIPVIVNPRGASLNTTEKSGFHRDEIFEVYRTIHPQLLELNKKGFLNGHTPFSALLAFISLLSALLTGNKHIALSNESSSNEATVMGTDINHQYSKSFEFEKDFNFYINKYFSGSFNYFSFLRPLNELQIASIFSSFPKYFPVFKSCNVGSKTDSWCGKCPKCLFAFIILSPFIAYEKLVWIFDNKDLLNDKDLLPYFSELSGMVQIKPFECVGTTDEVNLAMQMFIENNIFDKLPYLADYYYKNYYQKTKNNIDRNTILYNLEKEHLLNPILFSQLKSRLNERLSAKNS